MLVGGSRVLQCFREDAGTLQMFPWLYLLLWSGFLAIHRIVGVGSQLGVQLLGPDAHHRESTHSTSTTTTWTNSHSTAHQTSNLLLNEAELILEWILIIKTNWKHRLPLSLPLYPPFHEISRSTTVSFSCRPVVRIQQKPSSGLFLFKSKIPATLSHQLDAFVPHGSFCNLIRDHQNIEYLVRLLVSSLPFSQARLLQSESLSQVPSSVSFPLKKPFILCRPHLPSWGTVFQWNGKYLELHSHSTLRKRASAQ